MQEAPSMNDSHFAMRRSMNSMAAVPGGMGSNYMSNNMANTMANNMPIYRSFDQGALPSFARCLLCLTPFVAYDSFQMSHGSKPVWPLSSRTCAVQAWHTKAPRRQGRSQGFGASVFMTLTCVLMGRVCR